jgi:integrase
VVGPRGAHELLDALSYPDRAIWATALFAGLRLGELRALQWTDVDLEGGVINVTRSWDSREGAIEPKSRAGRRHVPIANVLRRVLIEQRLFSGGEGFVFGTVDKPFLQVVLSNGPVGRGARLGSNRLLPTRRGTRPRA